VENPGQTATFQSSLSKRKVITAMAGTMLAMFLATLYMTVVSTAMPRIITDLGGFSQYTWVFTAYFIAEVTTILIAGKLSDMYGRKWFYVACLSIFLVGSLLSGISQTMMQLIVFRALQGIGGGGMMALSFIVVADLFPPEERGKWQGAMSFVMVASTVIGPTLGGYLTDYLSWRWCFFINIPTGIAVAILFAFFYPHFQPASETRKIDYTGAVMTVLAIVPLMLALTWGGADYSWLSPIILGLLGFSLAMFIIFFIVERHAEEPIMPLHLFRNRVVVVSAIAVLLMGITFSPIMTFMPLYFQGVQGASAISSGNSMIPMMLAVALSSFICGQVLSRAGGYYRLMSTIGFIIMTVGFFLLSRMTTETSYATTIFNIILTGLGTGLIMPVHILAVQNTVPYAVMGTATSMLTWLRTVGNLFGLAIVGAILNNRFASEFMGNLSPKVKEVVPAEKLASMVDNPQALVNAGAREQLQSLFEGLGAQGSALFEQMLSTLQNALNFALTEIFAVVCIASVLALIVNLLLKGIPSHRRRQDMTASGPED
jgi:EmrB/QacA subfamily drug resistance transporter